MAIKCITITLNTGKLLMISVTSQSHFKSFHLSHFIYSMKEDLGDNFGPLVQNFRIWAEMKSYGHNITRNGFYYP